MDDRSKDEMDRLERLERKLDGIDDGLAAVAKRITGQAPPGPMQRGHIQPMEPYERREDMSSVGRLRVLIQDDGDVIVSVFSDEPSYASVEFCAPGAGGGRSPRVHRALQELAEAIALDNAERPVSRLDSYRP